MQFMSVRYVYVEGRRLLSSSSILCIRLGMSLFKGFYKDQVVIHKWKFVKNKLESIYASLGSFNKLDKVNTVAMRGFAHSNIKY